MFLAPCQSGLNTVVQRCTLAIKYDSYLHAWRFVVMLKYKSTAVSMWRTVANEQSLSRHLVLFDHSVPIFQTLLLLRSLNVMHCYYQVWSLSPLQSSFTIVQQAGMLQSSFINIYRYWMHRWNKVDHSLSENDGLLQSRITDHCLQML